MDEATRARITRLLTRRLHDTRAALTQAGADERSADVEEVLLSDLHLLDRYRYLWTHSATVPLTSLEKSELLKYFRYNSPASKEQQLEARIKALTWNFVVTEEHPNDAEPHLHLDLDLSSQGKRHEVVLQTYHPRTKQLAEAHAPLSAIQALLQATHADRRKFVLQAKELRRWGKSLPFDLQPSTWRNIVNAPW